MMLLFTMLKKYIGLKMDNPPINIERHITLTFTIIYQNAANKWQRENIGEKVWAIYDEDGFCLNVLPTKDEAIADVESGSYDLGS
jgi:hypothetical protein